MRNDNGRGPCSAPPIVRGGGLVWTVDPDATSVIGTNPESGRVFRDELVGTEPVAVAIGVPGRLVANSGNGSITRVPLVSSRIETIGLERPAVGDRDRRRATSGC